MGMCLIIMSSDRVHVYFGPSYLRQKKFKCEPALKTFLVSDQKGMRHSNGKTLNRRKYVPATHKYRYCGSFSTNLVTTLPNSVFPFPERLHSLPKFVSESPSRQIHMHTDKAIVWSRSIVVQSVLVWVQGFVPGKQLHAWLQIKTLTCACSHSQASCIHLNPVHREADLHKQTFNCYLFLANYVMQCFNDTVGNWTNLWI